MKNLFVSGILLLLSLFTSAQTSIEWQNVLGGSYLDAGQDIKQTSDGGYIAFGITSSNDGDVLSNYGGFDLWVVRLFPDGTVNWKKSIGGTQSDYGRSIIQTNDGGFLLLGSTKSSNPPVFTNQGNDDLFVIKLSSDGYVLWHNFIGGSASDAGYSIQQTSDGGYIVVGVSTSSDGDLTGNNGNADMWILKLSTIGIIEWQKNLGGSGGDAAYSVQETTDGGYIVAGSSGSSDGDVLNNAGNSDAWVVKLLSNGIIEWEKTFGGSNYETFYSVQQTNDGGYILSGDTHSSDGDVTENHGGYDIWVVKLTSTGAMEWQKTLGGSEWDREGRVRQMNDGGFIISGSTQSSDGDVSFNNGSSDIWLVKLTSMGVVSWEKSFGGGAQDYCYFGNGLEVTADGGLIIIGNTTSTDGDVISSGGHNWWVLKLSPILGINENNEQTQISVYPNPAINKIHVKTPAEMVGLSYSIQDFTGKIVLTGEVNNDNTLIELGNLTKGIYLIQIPTDEGISTSRFVKN